MSQHLREALTSTLEVKRLCEEALERRSVSGAKYAPGAFDVPTVIYALRALEKVEYHLSRVQTDFSEPKREPPF